MKPISGKNLTTVFKYVIGISIVEFVVIFLLGGFRLVFYFLLLGFKLALCIICWEFLKNLFSNHNSKGK